MDWKGLVFFVVKKLVGRLHHRISFKMFFVVEPAIWSDCPHFDSLSFAEEQAIDEDGLNELLKKRKRRWVDGKCEYTA